MFISCSRLFVRRRWFSAARLDKRSSPSNPSCMTGIAFGNASLGICRGIAHLLGAMMHLSHDRNNALPPHVTGFDAGLGETGTPPARARYAALAYLDVRHQLEVMAVSHRLADMGRAVVLVLHDLSRAPRDADCLADRRGLRRRGPDHRAGNFGRHPQDPAAKNPGELEKREGSPHGGHLLRDPGS